MFHENANVQQMTKQIDRLDRLFRKVLLNEAPDLVRCFTCPRTMHKEKFHVGHWLGRWKKSVRFDRMDAELQCPVCNVNDGGRPKIFEARLRAKHGDDAIDALVLKSKQTISHYDLDAIEEELNAMLK